MQNSLHCRWGKNGEEVPTMPLNTPVRELKPLETLERTYENYLKHVENEEAMPYLDTHCWTFAPSRFSLMARDLRHLGVVEYKVLEITQTLSSEFVVHLGKELVSEDERSRFYEDRTNLLCESAAYHRGQLPRGFG